jgi:superoxide reductase
MMSEKSLGGLINTYDSAAGEALGKRESHTPKIEVPDKVKPDEAILVKVAVGPHPNTMEHSIRWIQVYFVEEGRAFNPINIAKVSFNPGNADPEVVFRMKFAKSGVIHALEYCNLHGLWSSGKALKVG